MLKFSKYWNPKFSKYGKELLLKSYYNILLISFVWGVAIIKIDALLYFFAYYLLKNMHTPKIFFSNILEIFWIYFEISIYITFFWSLPFIFINYLIFFINSLYKHELKKLFKQFFFFFFTYIINFIIIYFFIFPNFLKFFLIFENSNIYFPLYFEARFEDYFLNYLRIFFKIFFFFTFPWILYILSKFLKLKIFLILKNKKIILLLFLFFSLLISPPDIYIQIFIFFIFLISFELLYFCLIFYFNFITNNLYEKKYTPYQKSNINYF